MRENVNTDKINPLPMGRSQKLALKFLDIDNKGKTSLKLKLQYFGYLMQRAYSLEKTLILRKIEGRRRRGQQRTKWLHGITYSTDISLSNLWELIKDREGWQAAIHRVTKSWTQLSD